MPERKRSLILAGGGLKVAFQAGVLQVWLDEAGLTFDHADGASGGAFNLAMYCQGLTGKEIADNWRKYDPLAGMDFNWGQYRRLFYAESIFEYGHFRERVLRETWRLDWPKIQATERTATFNLFNVDKQELEVITPDRMTEDHLIACVSLPMWFSPVEIAGQKYIDAVYVTDANLEEAIDRGADELWIVWTVSTRGDWFAGFVNQYFQIIESAANGPLRRLLRRIETNNAALEAGRAGEFGRVIDVHLLEAEVDMHYLVNINADRFEESVNHGVETARRWCRERKIPLKKEIPFTPARPAAPRAERNRLTFTEEMKGFLTPGETTDYHRGFQNGRRGHRPAHACAFRLTVHCDDLDKFLVDPDHEAVANGYVQYAPFGEEAGGDAGERFPVENGVFNLFADSDDPARKYIRYRLFFETAGGDRYTLSGFKDIQDDPGMDAWHDATTLFTKILVGHVNPENEEGAEIAAMGLLRVGMREFLEQLATFQVDGPDRYKALVRFGALYMGELWDVYAREIIAPSPF